MSHHLTLVRMTITKKSINKKCWRGCGEKGTLLHAGGNADWCSHYREQYRSSLKNQKKIQAPQRTGLPSWLSWERLRLRRPWFDSWAGKICWRRDRLPTPGFLGFPCGSAGKKSACNAGDLGSIPGLGRCPGVGKGYPLQCSGLENPMNCLVHGVTKSWTRLSDFHFPFPQWTAELFTIGSTWEQPKRASTAE